MAFHKHFQLSPFKLTHHSGAGVQVRDLHRNASGVPLPRNPSAERNSLAEDKSAPEFSQPQPLELGISPSCQRNLTLAVFAQHALFLVYLYVANDIV